MIFSKSTLMAIAMLGASTVDAHMKMKHPVPYSDSTLNNSPLAADGSDFPCKLRPNAFEAPSQPNVFKIGETQQLSFLGSAVHGGGSCQISLTTDMEPTKDSNWMVIKSFEGGCPAKAEGNLSGNDDTVFDFSIPEGISPGKYTLAWTWFNRIGNREMYMNCAPITVEGGSKKRDAEAETPGFTKRDNFPQMFVANINGCMTTEGYDITFPNPGSVVSKDGDPKNLLPQGQAACKGTPKWEAGNGSGGSGGGSSGGGSGSGSSSSSSGPAPTSAPSSGSTPIGTVTPIPIAKPTGAPGVFVQTSSAPAPEPSTPSSGSNSSSDAGSDSGSESSSGSGSGSALTGSCSSEGAWNCIGGSSFQRCANGQWTPAQQMAAGTQCTAGQGQDLQISASARSRMAREMRHRRAHGRIHA
ncbi:hypothetical protein PHISCL_05125 [Aspergillus sclerotialis]|uniref:Extracellular protein n=1 Tax=Aspergillus sclerotialis TaxID=2070753 RepID=A0A3A2ZH60_9EURO|nr:hypothetical protein PHISCL_05125 [Aspergillus sclerotialis]